MVVERVARWWFAANAVAVAAGIMIQVFATAGDDSGFFTDNPDKVLNIFAFFTIQANLIVGATCLLLAIGRARPTTVFRTFRLIGVVSISVTFVVFHAVLRDLQDLTGQAAVADFLLHTVSPVLCVAGWLLFGPRQQTTRTVVWLTLLFPLLWGAFTLVRGDLVGFYPYPFMNVTEKGYGRVAVNLVLVGCVFLGFSAGAHLLDGWLARRARR